MHIVILDGGSTNPGDVSWAPLRALGSVTVYDSTKPEEIVERAKDAEAVILNPQCYKPRNHAEIAEAALYRPSCNGV